MLRYLERAALVVPRGPRPATALYGLRELNQLRSLRELRDALRRRAHGRRLRGAAPARARAAAPRSTPGSPATDDSPRLDWEQRKHERLLATPRLTDEKD